MRGTSFCDNVLQPLKIVLLPITLPCESHPLSGTNPSWGPPHQMRRLLLLAARPCGSSTGGGVAVAVRWLSSSNRKQAKAQEFERLVLALKTFHAREGHFVVPYKYVVPATASTASVPDNGTSVPWPSETWGMELGKQTHYLSIGLIRGLKDPHKRHRLTSIGVPVDHWSAYKWDTVTFPALQTYKRLYSDLLVAQSFVVPWDDVQWPRKTWGEELGATVNRLRLQRANGTLSNDRIQELESLDFIWDVRQVRWCREILPALVEYKKQFGDLNVRQPFVVPVQNSGWPPPLHGLRLGFVVNQIRSRKDFMAVPGAVDQLHALGFDWDPVTTRFEQQILPSIECFKRLYGHCKIPYTFVVPVASPWPVKAWGISLGGTIQKIRSRGDFKTQIVKYQARWKALGL